MTTHCIEELLAENARLKEELANADETVDHHNECIRGIKQELSEARQALLRDARAATFAWYQEAAMRTMRCNTREEQVQMCAIGLAGEVGEVCEHIKKYSYHNKAMNQDAVAEELGDTLWYLSGMATAIGYSLEVIAERNIKKLAQRHNIAEGAPCMNE